MAVLALCGAVEPVGVCLFDDDEDHQQGMAERADELVAFSLQRQEVIAHFIFSHLHLPLSIAYLRHFRNVTITNAPISAEITETITITAVNPNSPEDSVSYGLDSWN